MNQPKPKSKEEIKLQALRAFMQKRNSLAETILFNLCQGCEEAWSQHPFVLVDKAVEMADHLMEKLYTPKAQDEPTDNPTD